MVKRRRENVEDGDDEEESDNSEDDEEIDSSEDDEEIDSSDEEVGCVINHGRLAKKRTYDAQKKYFEKFVVKVSGKGYTMPSIDGGASIITEAALKREFADCISSNGRSFIKRWLKDVTKASVEDVTFKPFPPDSSDDVHGNVKNLFQGYKQGLTSINGEERIPDLVKPWRIIGKELCEGDGDKFAFLEQYLAHLVQFPAERTNISFAFLGAKQGVFKNAFFTPLMHILGKHNYLETTDIHEVVHSSKNKCKTGCKLLCILDEARKRSTMLFQSQLKVCVTGTDVTMNRGVSYSVPACHRFIVLSNYIDGLGVDFASENRRFVMFQPTDVMKRISSKYLYDREVKPLKNVDGGENRFKQKFGKSDFCEKLWQNNVEKDPLDEFKEQYIKRFVDPGDDECINALYTYLLNMKLEEYKSTASWERKAKEMMAKSRLCQCPDPVPVHMKILYELTKPEPGPPPYHKRLPEQNGVIKCNPIPLEANDDSPGESQYEIEISRSALFGYYQGQAKGNPTLTQTKFSQEVSRILNGAWSFDDDNIDGGAPKPHDKKTNSGIRYWVFKTQPVHKCLKTYYPELGKTDANDDGLLERTLGIVHEIVSGDMFCG